MGCNRTRRRKYHHSTSQIKNETMALNKRINVKQNNTTQTLSLANCFELVYPKLQPRERFSKLENSDDLHSGQKSAFWSLENSSHTIVVTPSIPSSITFDYFSKGFFAPSPIFIQPKPSSTSVIANLLCDKVALSKLTKSLMQHTPIRLLPHIHTDQVELLSDWLTRRGYRVIDTPRHASLVRDLCDKLYVHKKVFSRHPTLAKMRPLSSIATTLDGIAKVASEFLAAGKTKLVVKSAVAVAGTGTYFLSSSEAKTATTLEALLTTSPGVQPTRSPPFLVEEHIPALFSPTVDIEIDVDRQIIITGVAIQRLRESKFYTGFYFTPKMTNTGWYQEVVHTSIILGKHLAEMGYTGPANIDFVVTSNKGVKLIELNPRHSALLDGFQIARKLNGRWDAREFSVADHVLCYASSIDDADQKLNRLRHRGDIYIVADTVLEKHMRFIAIWVSAWHGSSESLLCECAQLLSNLSPTDAPLPIESHPILSRQTWLMKQSSKHSSTATQQALLHPTSSV